MDIDGKRVLVLGGSGVLGGFLAAELTARGATIGLSGRDAGRLAAAADRLGGGVPTLVADLSDPHAPQRVVQWAVDELGGLDGLVNGAGVVAFGPLEETDAAALTEVITANLTAPLGLIAEAVPHMEQGGFVVNLSGVVAEQTVAGMVAYVAAKTGLSGASRALARDLRRRGILVVDARPPHTETGLASRPVAGATPRFPVGLSPESVARRIVEGIAADEREIPAAAFTGAGP